MPVGLLWRLGPAGPRDWTRSFAMLYIPLACPLWCGLDLIGRLYLCW